MCVILCATKERPSEAMVRAAFDHNDHGAGFAWRDTKDKKNVYFRKNLGLEESVELAATLPLPFIAHFRIASCGGKRPELTHPFPILESAPLDIEGKAPFVLFHNGHWHNWKNYMLEVAIRSGSKLKPHQPWSDSRAMAFIAARAGLGFLEMIDEKVVAFGPADTYVFGFGWKELKGVYCSNDHFETKMKRLEWDLDSERRNALREQRKPYAPGAYHVSPPASLPGGGTSNPPISGDGASGGSASQVPLGPSPAQGTLPPAGGGTQQQASSSVTASLSKKALRRLRKKQARGKLTDQDRLKLEAYEGEKRLQQMLEAPVQVH